MLSSQFVYLVNVRCYLVKKPELVKVPLLYAFLQCLLKRPEVLTEDCSVALFGQFTARFFVVFLLHLKVYQAIYACDNCERLWRSTLSSHYKSIEMPKFRREISAPPKSKCINKKRNQRCTVSLRKSIVFPITCIFFYMLAALLQSVIRSSYEYLPTRSRNQLARSQSSWWFRARPWIYVRLALT